QHARNVRARTPGIPGVVSAAELGKRFSRVPPCAIFVVAGLVAAIVIRVRNADLSVHAGLLAAATALLVLGAWGKRFVFRIEATTPAPVHRIVIGQAGMLLYFYARSALSHLLGLPGVSGGELYLLAAA